MIHAQHKMERLTEIMGSARMVSLLKRSEEELADYKFRIVRTLQQQDWVNAKKLTSRMMSSLLMIGDSSLQDVLDKIMTSSLSKKPQTSLIMEFSSELDQSISLVKSHIDALYSIEI